MRKRRDNGVSGCCAAFGIGLLIATICPPEFIMIFAAVALILLGCSRVRSR